MGVGAPSTGGLSSRSPCRSLQVCSLLRGGIAERGGVRVGHRIIEINGHSVVATPHARIIELLTEAHTEVCGQRAGPGGPPAGAGPP